MQNEWRTNDSGGGSTATVIATVILIAAAAVLVAALIIALSLDFGQDDPELSLQIKTLALSGTFTSFSGVTLTGGFVIGVATLLALYFVRTPPTASMAAIGGGAAAVAGILAALTVAAIFSDLTLLSEVDNDESGVLWGALLSDVASLGVLGAATWLGVQTARGR